MELNNTLTAVTMPVPNRFIILDENKLEIIVQMITTDDTMPYKILELPELCALQATPPP